MFPEAAQGRGAGVTGQRKGRSRNAYAAPAWAHEQRLGSVGLKATLMLLAAYADDEFSCYPGQAKIAAETEQGVRTVRRQVELLREVGLVVSERRATNDGHRTSDRHYLQLDVVVSVADVDAARARIEGRRFVSNELDSDDVQEANLTSWTRGHVLASGEGGS